MKAIPTLAILLPFALALACCKPDGGSGDQSPNGNQPETAQKILPLSPGVRIASHNSGGIAGISHLVEVTYDWKMIVVADNANFVRRLNGEEQKKINAALRNFASSHEVRSDDFPDGFISILVAQGTGKGEASAADSQALGKVLNELKSDPESLP